MYQEHKDNTKNKLDSIIHGAAVNRLGEIDDTPLSKLLSEGTSPREVQKTLETAIKEHPDFLLLLIEDLMGGGKTIASFFAALHALRRTGLQCLRYALPTTATAESMIKEIRTLMMRAGIKNTVSLATGTTFISEVAENTAIDEKLFRLLGTKILSAASVGTIDQVVRAVLAERFQDVNLSIMANTVLVIDEFHSYDVYMMTEIKKLLEWLKAYGCPVIILSATLTDDIKKDIYGVYGVRQTPDQSYPLISIVNNGKLIEYPSTSHFNRDHSVEIADIMQDIPAIADRAVNTIDRGGTMCVCVNTVNRARKIYAEIKKRCNDAELFLFIGRTSNGLKERMGGTIFEKFGKKGKTEGKRPKKAIVVATSIVSESLDIDFDYMMADIMPVDKLLQLLGRKCRHSDELTVRVNDWYKDTFVVMTPEDMDDLSDNFFRPYDNDLIRPSYDVICSHTSFSLPADMREMINTAYQNAGDTWKEKKHQEKFSSLKNIISSPSREDFKHNSIHELYKNVGTRYESYPSLTLILLDDDNTDTSTLDIPFLIRERAVSVPAYLLQDFIDSDCISYLWDSALITRSIAEKYNICLDEEYGLLVDGK